MNESRRILVVGRNYVAESNLDRLTTMPVRSASELGALAELGEDFTKERAYKYFWRKLDKGECTLGELILVARKVPETYPKNIDTAIKDYWRKLHEALDANGYIRHDFSEQDFRVGKLLKAVYLGGGTFIIDGIGSFVSNEQYETRKNISDDQLQKILNEVKAAVSEREYFVLTHWCGLEGNEPQTFTQISTMLNLSGQGTCHVRDTALRKLRRYAINNLGILYRYDEADLSKHIWVIEDELKQLKSQRAELEDELERTVRRIKQDMAKVDEQIGSEIQKLHNLATLPYRSAGFLWTKYDADFAKATFSSDISEVGFTARTYHCLFRRGIKTLDDIERRSRARYDGDIVKFLLSIRNMGMVSVKEVLAILRGHGYDAPDPETVK